MHKLLYILLFLFPLCAGAQVVESTADEVVPLPVEELDSLLQPVFEIEEGFSMASDSLMRITSVSDSLRLQQRLDSLQQLALNYDTLRLFRALDSLQQLELPKEKYEYKEDSIRRALDYSASLNLEIQSLQQE